MILSPNWFQTWKSSSQILRFLWPHSWTKDILQWKRNRHKNSFGPVLLYDCSFLDAIKGEITLKDIDGLLLEKIGQIEQSGSRVLLISSARDFHADPIYPTPVIEFPSSSKNNQYMNGDPAFINVSVQWKRDHTNFFRNLWESWYPFENSMFLPLKSPSDSGEGSWSGYKNFQKFRKIFYDPLYL